MTSQDVTSFRNVELGALSDAYIVAFFVFTSLNCYRWLPSGCLVGQIKTSPGVTFWHPVVCGHWHHGVTWSNKTLYITQNTPWQRGPYFCRTVYRFHILPYFVISCYAGCFLLFCFVFSRGTSQGIDNTMVSQWLTYNGCLGPCFDNSMALCLRTAAD